MKTGSIVTILATAIALISTAVLRSGNQVLNLEGNPGQFRIGATLPLTGDYASYGQAIKDGVELAREELKSKGIDLRLFYEDVPLPGPRAVTAIKHLISNQKIDALGANFFNPAMLTMAPIIQQANIPAFHTTAIDDLNLESGSNIVTTNSRIKDEAKLLAEHARNALKAKTASVIYVNTAFGECYAKHFKAHFIALGGSVLDYDTTEISATDTRPLLARVKSHHPDVIFTGYFGLNMGVVLKQAREVGIHQQILGVYETEDQSVIETAKLAAEGVQFFVPEPSIISSAQDSFQKRFVSKYNYLPGILAANGYDATMLLGRTFQRCKRDTKCVLDKIYSNETIDGASGKIKIFEDGGTDKGFVLKTVKNGKFVRLQ